MTTAIPYGRNPVDVIDVEAVEANVASPGGKARLAFTVLFVFLIIYGVISWIRIDSFKEENVVLATQVAGLNQQVSQLEGSLKGVDALRRELATTKFDLTAEIARKNALAVENTRLKGRVTQGERDLAAALQKLKVYEKPKARKK